MKRYPRCVLVFALAIAGSRALIAQSVPEVFRGHWKPFSNVFVVLLGDMDVTGSSVRFSRAGVGRIGAKVIQTSESSVLLELDKAADCGRFLWLGPIRIDPDARTKDEEVQVAIFKTREDATTMPDTFGPVGHSAAKYCIWGVYVR